MAERKRRGIEILAPASSMEGVYAAIAAGADAIYIGGTRFGARAYANNLDLHEMCAAIDYVHLYGKHIYLTVNTLLKPGEIDELYTYLKPYYQWGIDAVIVQDVGVLKFIADHFLGLPIHASTQMSLTMAEGAKCFERYPVTRLVNARELELAELKLLRKILHWKLSHLFMGHYATAIPDNAFSAVCWGEEAGTGGAVLSPAVCPMNFVTGNVC